MRQLTLFFLLSSAGSAPARAADIIVIQAGQMFLDGKAEAKATEIARTPARGKEFGLSKLVVKVGDRIVFKNLDKVSHNVYGEGFDLHAQPAGTTTAQTFDRVGRQTIRCAIHPKMKIELEVER